MDKTSGIFVDSDVIISSLMSKKGAAYLILNTKLEGLYISNYSKKETQKVIMRYNLDKKRFLSLVKSFKIVNLSNISTIKKQLRDFVADPNDAHILKGAMKPLRPWKDGVSSLRKTASFLPASSSPMEGRGIRRGEIKAKAKFLLTYNSKHFKIDKIKSEFGISIMSPGRFLQSLQNN